MTLQKMNSALLFVQNLAQVFHDEDVAQGFGVADIALEDFVGEREAVFIEGHADGHLPAIAALLFVFPMFGLGIFGANAFGK